MRSGSFLTVIQVKSFTKCFTEVHKVFFQGEGGMFWQYTSAYTHNVMSIDPSQPEKTIWFLLSVLFSDVQGYSKFGLPDEIVVLALRNLVEIVGKQSLEVDATV